MRLLVTEARRFFARRFVRIMLLVALVLLVALAVGTAVRHHRTTAAEVAAARQQVAAQQHTVDLQRVTCLREQADPRAGDGDFAQLPPGVTCADAFPANSVRLETFLPARWDLAGQGRGMLAIFAALLALLGFAVGASFVGAEWSSGGMVNQLLWWPRRARLLVTKLGALAVGVVASGIALLVLWVALLSGVALTRGYFGHFTAGLLRSFALLGARGFGLGLAAAFVGFAIASIGRATTLALGIAVGYLVVFEAGGRFIFATLLRQPHPEQFLLSTYSSAWLAKGASFDSSSCTAGAGPEPVCVVNHWAIGMYQAGGVLAVLALGMLTWAFVAFQRRDVT